jgi:hypothetical protein
MNGPIDWVRNPNDRVEEISVCITMKDAAAPPDFCFATCLYLKVQAYPALPRNLSVVGFHFT